MSIRFAILLGALLILTHFQAANAALKPVSRITPIAIANTPWNAKTGRSQDIALNIPAGAISFTIYAHSATQDEFYLIDSVKDPSGRIFVSPVLNSTLKAPPETKDGFGVGPLYSPNTSTIAMAPGFASLLVPNSPQLPFSPGQWKFAVRGIHANGSVSTRAPQILVLVKTKVGPISNATRGQINLHFQFTGSDALTAASAKTDASFQASLQKLAAIYAKIGITLTPRSYEDLSFPGGMANLQTKEAIDLYQKGSGIDGVNLIFVHQIYLGQGQTAQGYSGALVGPEQIKNSVLNGVLSVTEPFNPLERRPPTANVMAHEMGHYLGLPHTFEQSNATYLHDPFSDTPKQIQSNNLMSPDLDRDASELSAQQRQQLLLNPAVTLYE